MSFKLNITQKLFLVATSFFIAVIGFILKLPAVFSHYDKELHAAFYFFAALFLNLLFQKKHFIIFGFLFFFGIFIELFQHYSNRFVTKRIHGNFDPEDLASNLAGLLLFSFFWLFLKALFGLRKLIQNNSK